MHLGLLDIILIILFVQSLSLIPFFLFDKNRPQSNNYLGLFLLAKALCITAFIGSRLWDYTFHHLPISIIFGQSFTLLWGPLIYLYTRSLSTTRKRFEKTDVLHISPFLFHFLYLLFNFHLKATSEKQEILSNGLLPDAFFELSTYYIHLSILCYTLVSFFLLKNYHFSIKNTYSTIDKIKLNWMLIVLAGFSIKWLADMWFFTGMHFFNTFNMPALYVSRTVLFIFINALIYFGFKQSATMDHALPVNIKRSNSLSDKVRKDYLNILTAFMLETKIWQDPDITITTLSNHVGIPQRSLSEVLNKEIGMNFYDYINMYRINESQKILVGENEKRTILEILFEVGFNNKTSFNIAFKRITGMTPTQYRKSAR